MNYDRYLNDTEEHYNKKSISYYLMRHPSDQILIPYVSRIENAKVLEAGVGYGYYTRFYINNGNDIVGLDANPQMGKNIGIEIVQGLANELREKIQGRFDYILSFFMTEYLSYKELEAFLVQGTDRLERGGILATTIILNRGLGKLYIFLAGMKGIQKYNYSKSQILSMIRQLKNVKIRVTPLQTVMKIPFAVLLEIKKK